MRRSPVCGGLAVVAAQIGLWVALHDLDLGFLQHPQLWLIPIAFTMLAAEFIHHDRLTETQSAGLRYLSLSVIYISSTADMFIAGLGESWLLPLALMLLSVAGAMTGLLLKIRSFLSLGVTFLLLDIITMIYYAAFDLKHTWIVWITGIVLGFIIIAVFALFEKRRNDIIQAVERFKKWEK
jgi:hypothetical protein